MRDEDALPVVSEASLTTHELARARVYERASLSTATLRAYAQSWADFEAWAALRGARTDRLIITHS